ncbi:MAG: 23S rRNA (pseudouridine(1915)-N(3))-methyltransferase RlmH [Clostridia bacterium]|nr:23S rRNA (pseudouridine(1915)-N(3))-methyltransferase RlmH [Clostridia bacterium]
MANITLISVGTLKEGYLKEAVAEYKKRLSQYARVDEINIKEERIANEDDASEVRRALDAEGERIIASIPKGSGKIALCVEGKQYDSPALAGLIGRMADESGKITLIIGSSHGLADKVKRECDVRLSVSALTFPHQLMRVVLFEALYRSFTILAGKKYHK